MKKQIRLLMTCLFVALSGGLVADAQVASGGSFKVEQSVVANGGGTSAEAGNTYKVEGTAGQSAAGNILHGSPFSHTGGFWVDLTINVPPDAVNDALSSVAEDSGMRTIAIALLLSNDATGAGGANESGQTLTFSLVGGTEVGGTISSDATNVYFTPAANFNGTASFQYTVTDNGTTTGVPDPKSDTATVSFTVTAVNDAPTVTNNTGTTVNEGSTGNTITTAQLKVSDVDNTDAQLTYTLGTPPSHGTLRKSGAPVGSGGTFTQDDINNNLVTYDHDGSETISDVFSFTVSDGAGGTIGSTNFHITVTPVNDGPTIAAVGATRTAGSPASNSTIANVSDAEDARNTLSVTINNGSSATATGVTVSNLAISAAGVVTADVVAACNAATANFILKVTDSGGLNATATLTVIVNANHAPTLTYNNSPTVGFGGSLMVNPLAVPSDNGSISSIVVQSQGTYTGTISVSNATGVVSISNAAPAGTHTITIRATDNCGTTTDASFNLVVGAPPTLSISDVSVTEGDSGTKTLNFTVTLSAASNLAVTVNYATANGTANAGSDYLAINSTMLTFDSGETTKTISVTVNGDQAFEPDETFFINLSGASNATISDNQGLGTILNDDAQGGIISFSSGNYTVAEDGRAVTITVNRTGDTSAPATVDYATSDDSDPSKMVSCATVNGIASSRCDFTTAAGTLKFAAGETSKSFKVLISQDSYVENSETFPITLSNLTGGAVFAAPSITTVTITDDAPEPATNPIDDADNFVREHYHDFLNREGDPAGQAFWTNRITDCGNDAACIQRQRIGVSAEFFIEQEFQQTGFYVYRAYKGALDRRPSYVEFMTDRSQLQATPSLDAEKVTYTLEFVQRGEFTTKYPLALNGPGFVDALIQNVQTNSGADLTPRRNELLAAYNAGSDQSDSRARTLRTLVDHDDFKSAEYNRSFVLAQYFSYLRREPDTAGYDFWVNVLNNNPSNFRVMVCNFLTSGEYQDRFGVVRTHNNSECNGSPIAEEAP